MFKKKRKVKVFAEVFNLAGDVKDRPNFLKTVIFDQALFQPYPSFSESLATNYLNGTGMKLRRMVPEALKLDYYSKVGQSSATFTSFSSVGTDKVLDALLFYTGKDVRVVDFTISGPDLDWWGLRYLLENDPSRTEEIYETSLDDNGFIIIEFFEDDEALEPEEILNTGISGSSIDNNAEYLFVYYSSTDVDGTRQEVLIYKKGSGIHVFEELFNAAVTQGRFFPVLPVKYDSHPGTKPKPVYIDSKITGAAKEVYNLNVKLLDKISGKKGYEKILDSLKDNNSAGEVNYAYIFYGASLNSPANSAKKYIFEFFKTLGLDSSSSSNDYQSYKDAYNIAHVSREHWVEWKNAQEDPDHPLYNTQEPVLLAYPTPPISSASFKSSSYLNLNYKISWNHVVLTSGTGLLPDLRSGKTKIKKGGLSLPEIRIDINGNAIEVTESTSSTGSGESFTITYQKNNNYWEAITVHGLHAINTVHRGKSVITTSGMALNDSDESPLLIPLHETIFKKVGLVDATQFGASSSYLMITYYSDTKQKWYETKLFKIILIIVVIVVSVFSGGLAGGALTGVGASMATALGLTGMAAIIFAAAVNAVAGLILTRIITTVSTKLFGDKIGMIIGVILSIVAVNAMQSYFNNTPVNLLDNFTAENVIKMTQSIGGELNKQMQQEVKNIAEKMEAEKSEFDKESDKISRMYYNEFGDRADTSVMGFLDAMHPASAMNAPSVFLQRTLFTGSDIASITMDAIAQTTDLDNTLMLEV